MGGKTYEGRFLREISFSLGGIGADSIGLAGNGRLIDREIFNRPNSCRQRQAYRPGDIQPPEQAVGERIYQFRDKSGTRRRSPRRYTGQYRRSQVLHLYAPYERRIFTPSSTPQRSICLCTLRRTRRSNYSAKKGGLGARITARRKAACGSGGGGRRYPRHKRIGIRGEEG